MKANNSEGVKFLLDTLFEIPPWYGFFLSNAGVELMPWESDRYFFGFLVEENITDDAAPWLTRA